MTLAATKTTATQQKSLQAHMQAFKAKKQRQRQQAVAKEQARERRIMKRMLEEGPVESAISNAFAVLMTGSGGGGGGGGECGCGDGGGC